MISNREVALYYSDYNNEQWLIEQERESEYEALKYMLNIEEIGNFRQTKRHAIQIKSNYRVSRGTIKAENFTNSHLLSGTSGRQYKCKSSIRSITALGKKVNDLRRENNTNRH